MRIAVCDEHVMQRRLLQRLLQAALAKYSIVLQIETYENGADLLSDIESGVCFDVIFLEVSAATWTGLETARELRRLHYTGDIIFSSETAEFAVAGYEVGASGYLLKPYTAERLIGLVKRLSKRERSSCLMIHRHQTVVCIPYHDIQYIESRNAKCIIHHRDGHEHTVYRHLQDLEDELQDKRFLRCHQSYLVNMDYVVKADHQFEMVGGDVVSIRQRDRRQIREIYRRYCESGIGEMITP